MSLNLLLQTLGHGQAKALRLDFADFIKVLEQFAAQHAVVDQAVMDTQHRQLQAAGGLQCSAVATQFPQGAGQRSMVVAVLLISNLAAQAQTAVMGLGQVEVSPPHQGPQPSLSGNSQSLFIVGDGFVQQIGKKAGGAQVE